MPARGEQAPRVGAGDRQLDQALRGDEAEDRDVRPQRGHRSSTSPAQVKPGPKAVIMTRSGRPRVDAARSSTNSTVGALMLPWSRSTCAFEVERCRGEVERFLDRVDDLGPAGVAAEAVDVAAGRGPCSAEDAVDRLGQFGSSTNGGMARSKITASPGSSTRQPMMPSVSGHNFSPAPRIVARPSPCGRDHGRRRAVAEQGGGDDRRGVVAVEADRDRAGLDA